MSEACDNDCGSCAQNCADRKAPNDFRVHLNDQSRVGSVVAVVSGKGGVGKSLVTSLLAKGATGRGLNAAILDADITGPSIPRAFGVTGKATGTGEYLLPRVSRDGVQIMSINMLLDSDTDPVVWRGPILAGTVKQFYTDVLWRDVDVMFVDLPPGTGDVPLTVFQSLPLDGIVVVTSPQELVGMIVGKAVNMARMMQVPILGLVENMAYFTCPDNGKTYHIFGKGKAAGVAIEYGIPLLGSIPIDPTIADACDAGRVEDLTGDWLAPALDVIAGIASAKKNA